MSVFKTTENYLELFGGPVNIVEQEDSQAEVSLNGKFRVKFSRPIMFPTFLMRDYNPTYNEKVPELEPSTSQKQAIDELFAVLKEQYQEDISQAQAKADALALENCIAQKEQPIDSASDTKAESSDESDSKKTSEGDSKEVS